MTGHPKDTKWHDDAVDNLTRLWNDGYTAQKIADALGDGISRCAVIGKARRLGLSSRVAGANPRRREAASRGSDARFENLPKPPVRRKKYGPSPTIALGGPHWNFKLVKRPEEKTKSQLRAEFAEAVRNTAAMPVE